jgi:hypothetical protein
MRKYMTEVKTKSDLYFDALRNALYHSARKAYFDLLNRTLSFVIILAGGTAAADFGSRWGLDFKLLAFVAAVVAALQLVFDFGMRARTHEFLQRRYYEMIAKISAKPNTAKKELGEWEAELNRIYSEEPTPMRALDAIAYNAACEALGRSDKRVKVSWWQSLMRHFLPFQRAEFPYEYQSRAA